MSTPDGYRVSVVIPTIGRPSLAKTQGALALQTRMADEILVIEDTDRRGPAWARNQGVARATGDLIACIDDDCIPPADWLVALVEAIDFVPDAAASGGTCIEEDPLLQAMRDRKDTPREMVSDPGLYAGGAGNIMFRKTWLAKLIEQDGYAFNENFGPVAEDWEMIKRLAALGAQFVFTPRANVLHTKRLHALPYLRHQFARGEGIAALYRLNTSSNGPRVQKSILWSGNPRTRIFRILWHKVLGPFDVANFPSVPAFLLFWIGEKVQGAGFIKGILSAPKAPVIK